MFVILQRVSLTREGTYGNLLDENFIPFMLTVERRWNDNKSCTCNQRPCVCDSSCIPAGIYKCRKYKRSNGQITFEILHVPNRTDILMHVGNTREDSNGCIMYGLQWGDVNGIHGVHKSRDAFKSFMQRFKKYDEFIIFILNPNQGLKELGELLL